MLRLFSLLLLIIAFSACGEGGSQIYGDHVKREKVFKNIPNVVYGNVQVPKGKSLSAVEIFYKEDFQNDLAGLQNIKAEKCTKSSLDSFSKALFCQDSNFFFSGIASNLSIVRATFDDGTFLDSLVLSTKSSVNVSISEYTDWENMNGIRITINTPGKNSGTTLTDHSMRYLSLRAADAMFRTKSTTPVPWLPTTMPSQELFNNTSTFLTLSSELNDANAARQYSLKAPEFYLQLINFDRYLLSASPQKLYLDYFNATIDLNPDICLASYDCFLESIGRMPNNTIYFNASQNMTIDQNPDICLASYDCFLESISRMASAVAQ